MKVGQAVRIREQAGSLWSGRAGNIVLIQSLNDKYLVEFATGERLWFLRKEVVRV